MEPVIELNGISKTYVYRHLWTEKRTVALSDVSFSVNRNDVFGLIGLNGAGKTTLIKILLGLIWKSAGSAKILSKNVPDISVMHSLGYLPEIPYFLSYMTPREVLFLYADFFGMDKKTAAERIERNLETVGLSGSGDTRMKGFSKGMLQRVSFAACSLNDPELMLMDEPNTGLDPLGIISMREFIRDMQAAGKTIFFSSHMIEEVEKIATRVAILKNGRLAGVFERKDFEGRLEKIFLDTVKDTRLAELK